MSSLPTSQEIYDRIRWDRGFDPSWFTIGYEDRERGLQETPFTSFIPGGDVPWHRVQYFRCGETLVWDRRTRTDLLATLRQTPAAPRDRQKQAPRSFRSREAFLSHVRSTPGSPASVLVRPATGYPSFVEDIWLSTSPSGHSRLYVEWRSYAMDWMGDATHVMVVYEFDTLEGLLEYVQRRYGRGVTDFTPTSPPLPEGTPLMSGYPQPLVPIFQEAWRRLKADFAAGKLIDEEQRIVQRFGGF